MITTQRLIVRAWAEVTGRARGLTVRFWPARIDEQQEAEAYWESIGLNMPLEERASWLRELATNAPTVKHRVPRALR